jgi:membrane-associated phospholipid phosphatase
MQWLFSTEPIGAVQRAFGPGALRFFEAIDLLGDVTGIVLVFAMILWVAGRGLAYRTLGAVLFGGAIVFPLVFLIGTPRPDDPNIIVHLHVGIPTFPSGHVATATVMWGTLVASGVIPAGLAVLIIASVGLGRLYLGVHYPADVLAAPLFGLAALGLYLWRLPRLERWFATQPFRFYVAIAIPSFIGALIALPFVLDTVNGWQGAGATIGGAIAMPLEHRFLRYTPTPASRRQQGLKLAIGLAGMAALLVPAGQAAAAGLTWLGAGAFALAQVWAMLAAPLIFARLGLGQTHVRCDK